MAILSEADSALVESAYAIGLHLGMAFQLLDDVLDFVGEEANLGKSAGGSDLQLGLATGPVLFAAQQVSYLLFVILSIFGPRSSSVCLYIKIFGTISLK